MSRRVLSAAVGLSVFALTPCAFAQKVKFTEHTLKNGLRVILSEDHSAPTYSISVTYNVGSRDEKPGRTGFAHLFEHMMFQGSANVGKGEHFIAISNSGGTFNGTTSSDRTNYFATLPSNQIDVGLFLESDRMRALAITQSNLDNQRATVQEERRQSYDNQAYGRTSETIIGLAYDTFAYQHSTIGSMADLDAATLQDVSEFFRIYYAPNNAVLVMVGDFKTNDLLARIRKYFEDIPRQTAPPAPNMAEPMQTAERRKTIEDGLAQLTRLDITFKIPPGNTDNWYALSVAGRILGSGQSSRLYQLLVREKEVAQSVSAGAGERRGPGLFNITVTLRPGKKPEDVEKLIYEELENLKKTPVTVEELQKTVMQARSANAQQLEGTLGRAQRLGQFAVFYNEPDLVNTQIVKLTSVTAQRIQQAASAYFISTGRTVVITVPKTASSAGGEN
jgi:predicted Zn-dependent peptidase